MARSSTAARARIRAPEKRTRSDVWLRLRWLLTGPLGLVLLVVALGWYVSLDLDDLKRHAPAGAQPSITLVAADGTTFARLGNRYGEYLSLDQISPWLPRAVVATEDRRFFQHPGFDPIGILRALVQNIRAGRVVEGGSTISQQLAKVAFLTPERSLSRKFKEALYTLWLEARFNKEQILEAYLNRIYLGSGSYGVDAASRRYFDKPARDLSLAESAMLAGLIRAPSRYAPTRDLELARERASVVLDGMVEAAFITAEHAAEAKANPATLAQPATRDDTGYFADWAAAETQLYADPLHHRLTVRTTLDPDVQHAAEQAVRNVLARHGGERGVEQVALVAMDHQGRIGALLGGRSYAQSQFNRATQAERQPGSAFKLFVYLAALEQGLRPSDPISGAPIEVEGWRPANFENGSHDGMSIADSFVLSVNTAAVRLSEQVGRDRVIELAQRLGITSDLRSHPSLALGTSEVNLLELTAAYATVANHGRLVWPEGIEEIQGDQGRVLYRPQQVDEPVVEPGVVRAMTAMLETTISRGTGRQAALRRFVAGKTGTSADHRDAYFVGFTDEIVVGVWVGNDDGRPMQRVTGGGLPAQIFREFILAAYGDEAFMPPPAPPKPPQGPFPVEAIKDAIGEIVGGAVDGIARAIKGLFGN